ncbi:Glycine cleavage T-protein family [Perilla frutescens var. hirtella]|nr:Glycine cleavage T-protein family [Perilla frutescens var. hirtella]
MDEENFLIWRIEKGVAEGSAEIPKVITRSVLVLLFCHLSLVAWPGCYVGRELIARAHHRGAILKRLMPIRFLSHSGKEVEQQVSPGSEVIDTASKRKAGAVVTALGSRGLALVRFQRDRYRFVEVSNYRLHARSIVWNIISAIQSDFCELSCLGFRAHPLKFCVDQVLESARFCHSLRAGKQLEDDNPVSIDVALLCESPCMVYSGSRRCLQEAREGQNPESKVSTAGPR